MERERDWQTAAQLRSFVLLLILLACIAYALVPTVVEPFVVGAIGTLAMLGVAVDGRREAMNEWLPPQASEPEIVHAGQPAQAPLWCDMTVGPDGTTRYQWYRGTVPIPGATQADYVLSEVSDGRR